MSEGKAETMVRDKSDPYVLQVKVMERKQKLILISMCARGGSGHTNAKLGRRVGSDIELTYSSSRVNAF